MKDGKVTAGEFETTSVFSCSFNKLTERYFMKSAWPEPEHIAPIVGNGKS